VRPRVAAGPLNERIKGIIASIAPHDSPERFRELGVNVYLDAGRFTSDHTVALERGGEISAPLIVIAAGSSPLVPPIPGLREAGVLTNRDLFSLERIPSTLIVLGGGPIGCEMGQAFARLGTRVVLVDMLPHVLGIEDPDMAAPVQNALREEGVELRLGRKAVSVEAEKRTKRVHLESDEGPEEVRSEEILAALGRRGNTAGLGLEAAGVTVENSFIPTDDALRTNRRHIYACGDVNGRYLFTHAAGAEASFIVRKALLHLPGRMSYDHIPWSTYTDPALASVGLNEKRARERGLRYRTLTAEFTDNDRAWAEGAEGGRMKILLDTRERVIGVQIAAAGAGELLAPALFAVRERWKISRFMGPVYPYPTLSEVYRKAAADHLSPRLFNERVRGLLKLLFRYRG
jgi:pyruvate/2-oxoglutarate dehydrogenase complex dihydrolipoamide dehydrogenase (E3) component